MSRQVQIRRGSATAHENFTGALGEITMDTTNKTLRVHDGETAGGIKLAKQSEIPTITTKANIDMDNITSAGKTVIVRIDRPDYTAKVEISAADNVTWTAPSDGWVYFQGGSSGAAMYLDSTKTSDVLISGYGSNSSVSSSCFLPVIGGYTYYFTKAVAFRRFYPSQGVA